MQQNINDNVVNYRKGNAVFICNYVSVRTGQICGRQCKSEYCGRHSRARNTFEKKISECRICHKLTRSMSGVCGSHKSDYMRGFREIHSKISNVN
jgi:hypothetical protein